ncbi:MAG: MATE family efflux transporter, partial [Actinobacteria bacterium]|nr:MATE family efflux transporter [Actinomycetota bacterium]
GVVNKVAMFCIFPIVGVSMAAQPLIGYNYGAHNYMRVKQTLKVAMLWATALLAVFFALIHLFPHGIVALFGISDELLDFTIEALKIYTFGFPIIGAQIIGSNYFQATGQPLKSAVLSLMRQLIFLVPLIYWVPQILPTHFPAISGLMAVCYATPMADVLSSIFTGVFVLYEIKRLNTLMLKHREHSTCSVDA